MAEKILNARTQQKHDIEANWDKATNFIPKAGEIIVYDEDAAHPHPRMKIGDGTNYLADLEFLVNIDTTLTKSSAAADAKTVGDAITSINTIIENFDNIIAVDENDDGNVVLKRYNADGSEDSGSGAAAIHAEQHAADGIDPITPEMIGAMPASYVAPVVSVNGYEGEVELTADDVGAVPVVAEYYTPSTGMSADDLTGPFALIPISSEVNAELYEILGGTFAWVRTYFYSEVSTTAKRMQVATSYNTINQKMAFRNYTTNGWLPWEEVALASNKVTDVVTSVNGQTGEVVLSASDVGALSTTGGTATGSLWVNAEGEGDIGVQYAAGKSLYLYGNKTNGNRGIYDTDQGAVITVSNDGKVFNGTAAFAGSAWKASCLEDATFTRATASTTIELAASGYKSQIAVDLPDISGYVPIALERVSSDSSYVFFYHQWFGHYAVNARDIGFSCRNTKNSVLTTTITVCALYVKVS